MLESSHALFDGVVKKVFSWVPGIVADEAAMLQGNSREEGGRGSANRHHREKLNIRHATHRMTDVRLRDGAH